jgi:beta-glucosidase
VSRVLTVKEKLGLLNDPFLRLRSARPQTVADRSEHLALAREAGRKSIVLLKNDGGLLPLQTSGKRIALIGPFAEGKHDLVGPWTVFSSDAQSVDLATGIRSSLRDPTLLSVVEGCKPNATIIGGIEAALAAAEPADVILLAIGESAGMSGEASSRADIVIPAPQQSLAEALAATGKPMVVVLKNGRALALEGAVLAAPAVLVTWFLGSQTGHAIADVLFGRESPAGRLPVSFPRVPGQVPYYYAHKSTGRPNPRGALQPFKTHYQGVPNTAEFPFGHGLTYSTIEYADLDLGGATLHTLSSLRVSARITNSGALAATEVVQLYIRDLAASVTRPVRELKGFHRVELASGKSQRVSFVLDAAMLAFPSADLTSRAEPGSFQVWIAPSAEAEGVSGKIVLTS